MLHSSEGSSALQSCCSAATMHAEVGMPGLGRRHASVLSLQPCTGSSCEASVEAHFSYVMLGLTLLGAALYWWAGPLSHSMPFRLSAGSLGFMALSVLILIFVLSRFVATSTLLCI